ncbi:MAG: sporulation transcriptional regulator SpoIIID [Clostridia bacterium]|nr:sporulation transcriptional regulator SpoIIID [Clostridia bacterium]
MKDDLMERTLCIARHIAEKKATVRSASKAFGLSKSTVHKDMEERLRHLDPVLFREVRRVLKHNKAVRHLRGGEATRRKYRGEG